MYILGSVWIHEALGIITEKYQGSVFLVSSAYYGQFPIKKEKKLLFVLIGQWLLFTDALWDLDRQIVLMSLVLSVHRNIRLGATLYIFLCASELLFVVSQDIFSSK